MKKVGIIGCGWLGLELAKSLLKLGFSLRGTTTDIEKCESMNKLGIESVVYLLGNALPEQFLDNLSHLIISFPIKNTIQIEKLHKLVSDLNEYLTLETTIIFTSSISVYNNNFQVHTVNSACLDEENMNLKFEKILQERLKNSVLILRLGGLISDDRHPVHFLAGKSNLKEGNSPVNLIHRGDIIRFIEKCLNENVTEATYNLVYPSHPTKIEYYQRKAIELNLPPPHFENSVVSGKTIASSIQIKETKFDYLYEL